MTAISTLADHVVETTFSYPPNLSRDELLPFVRQASNLPHPRILATEHELRNMAKSTADNPLAEAVIREADALIDLPPIKRIKQGRRLLGQSRRCVKRTIVLATAYYLTENQRYADRCRDEMLAVAAFSDWNPSHYLDVAEMTFAMAVGYDWLFDRIDAESRRIIRDAILRKGVRVPLDTEYNGWTKASNNWGQVCHGGMLAGALAVLEDDEEAAAATLQRALDNLPRSMAAYAPNGSYPEGPGYWAYGTTYNVLLIAMLEHAFKTDFGLTQAPGFSKTGEYIPLTTGPSGLCFNYADGGAARAVQPALFWFAARFNRPDWLHGEPERLTNRLKHLGQKTAGSQADRFLPLVLHWLNPDRRNEEILSPLHWNGEGPTPITIHRSSWTDPNATFIGFKAGSPSGPHGQMDTGSFVLDADGVRWAVDLGAEGYHGIESRGMNLWNNHQNSDRWRIFRQMNHGHNTLVIDDQLQVAAGFAKIVRFSDRKSFPHSVADLSPVYQGQADTVIRGIAMLPTGEVLIQDTLRGLKPGSSVRWGMITPGRIDSMTDDVLVLRQRARKLTLQRVSPSSSPWRTIDTATPRQEWDSPNKGTIMLAFEAMAPATGNLDLAVLLTPGSCPNSMIDTLELTAPLNWK